MYVGGWGGFVGKTLSGSKGQIFQKRKRRGGGWWLRGVVDCFKVGRNDDWWCQSRGDEKFRTSWAGCSWWYVFVVLSQMDEQERKEEDCVPGEADLFVSSDGARVEARRAELIVAVKRRWLSVLPASADVWVDLAWDRWLAAGR